MTFAPADNNRAQWFFEGSPGYVYSRPTLPNLPPTRAFVPDQSWSTCCSFLPPGLDARVIAAASGLGALGVMTPSSFDWRTQDRQCLAAGGRCRDTRVIGAVPGGYGARARLCPNGPAYVKCVVPIASMGSGGPSPVAPPRPSQSNAPALPTDAVPGTYTSPEEGAPQGSGPGGLSSIWGWLAGGAGLLLVLGVGAYALMRKKPKSNRRRRRNAGKGKAPYRLWGRRWDTRVDSWAVLDFPFGFRRYEGAFAEAERLSRMTGNWIQIRDSKGAVVWERKPTSVMQ